MLLLALIHNNWRFQKHSTANRIMLILWKEKDRSEEIPFIHCCKRLLLHHILFRIGGAALLRFRVLTEKGPLLSICAVTFRIQDIKQPLNPASVQLCLYKLRDIFLYWNWDSQCHLKGWQNPQLFFAKWSAKYTLKSVYTHQEEDTVVIYTLSNLAR